MNAMWEAHRTAGTLGDFDAFVRNGCAFRAQVLNDHSRRLAAALVGNGLSPGDRVLLWLPNGPELALAWRAVLWAGGVAVVAHDDAPPARLRQLLQQTGAKAIVTEAGRENDELAASLPECRVHAGAGAAAASWLSLSEIVRTCAPLAQPVARRGDDTAFVQYTSGSTGTPVGVVFTHRQLAKRLNGGASRFARWRRPVRELCVLPMASSFGSHPLFESLVRRSTQYILGAFDPEKALAAVETHRIQRLHLVPAMCEAMLALPASRRFDLSSLKAVVCSGAKVTATLIERFHQRFGIMLDVRYGMTGIGAVSRTSASSTPGSVGRPHLRLQAKIVDAEGRGLPVGEVGELVLRSKRKAILHQGENGAAQSVPQTEMYRTGDLARFNAAGELFIVGRADDLIIQGGHNIHAQELAEIVGALPEIRECAVVGIASDLLGQDAVVCIALHDGARLNAEDVIAHCRAHLEAKAVPASVWFTEALPRNPAGKVMNHALREAVVEARRTVRDTALLRRLEIAAPEQRHALLKDEVQKLLAGVLRAQGVDGATEDGDFLSHGLDSLGAVELTHALSRAIGRPVPATLVYSHRDADAVSAYLLERLGWSSRAVAVAPAVEILAPEELRLDAFLTEPEIAASRALPPAASKPSCLFLTGATGFLGRSLVLEILDRLPRDGRLHCLVRAGEEPAIERLRAAFSATPGLRDRLNTHFAEKRLILHNGDLAHEKLGLDAEVYRMLSTEVESIVHAGALVDHLRRYEDLFAANVLGTAEIMRFAVTGRLKPINYVSTIAARSARASGYAASKRAGEMLLIALNEEAGVPVRLFRPSHILADRKIEGHINPNDTLTRLLHGLVVTGVAPRSFYRDGDGVPSFDGVPADWVAGTIASACLGCFGRETLEENNLANPQRHVSLDSIAGWVASAGHDIEEIASYSDWHRVFRQKLEALPRHQRERSLLPLLQQWESPKETRAHQNAARRLRHFTRILRRRKRAVHPEVPPITEAFIHKCLADMHHLGVFDEGRGAGSEAAFVQAE